MEPSGIASRRTDAICAQLVQLISHDGPIGSQQLAADKLLDLAQTTECRPGVAKVLPSIVKMLAAAQYSTEGPHNAVLSSYIKVVAATVAVPGLQGWLIQQAAAQSCRYFCKATSQEGRLQAAQAVTRMAVLHPKAAKTEWQKNTHAVLDDIVQLAIEKGPWQELCMIQPWTLLERRPTCICLTLTG